MPQNKPENETDWVACLEAWVIRVGEVAMWLNVVLMGLIVLQVVLRYCFGGGLVALEELQWHAYAVAFMVGIAYAMVEDTHIRVDIFYSHMSARQKAWVDTLGITCLIFPFVLAIFWHGLGFTIRAYEMGESSISPLGLPWRWLIKATIPTTMILLAMASLARLIRSMRVITSQNHPQKKGVKN